MILAQCGSCENQLKFPDDWIGKQIQCPNCGSMVELPAIAVAKPIRNSEKRIDARPREITTKSLIDIDVSNEQQTPKKNHGDSENDANHNDETERTDTSDEYSIVSPTVANSQSPQPYQSGLTPLNQPTADPYTGTPINVRPVPGNSYPAPSDISAPPPALPTFDQYQANKPVQAQPVQATATPVQNDAPNDALPAIAKAVPIATASPQVIPAQEIAATTPVPTPHPTSSQPTNAKRPQLDKKPKFGEKKTIKLSPGAKKAVLYGSIGTALVVAVLLSLVFIQKMVTSGPVRTFEAYKIAVKNNDFAALYDVVDSATRDTFDNYAEAKSKETPVDNSLVGKDKFVAVATQRSESIDAIKQKTIDSKLQLIEKATIVSESVNRNRASVQVRFEEDATESITFEKVDGDWKIGVPTFSLLFVEY